MMGARFELRNGMEVFVRCGAHTLRRAKILPYAAQGRRNRTICIEFIGGKLGGAERWVRPDQIERAA